MCIMFGNAARNYTEWNGKRNDAWTNRVGHNKAQKRQKQQLNKISVYNVIYSKTYFLHIYFIRTSAVCYYIIIIILVWISFSLPLFLFLALSVSSCACVFILRIYPLKFRYDFWMWLFMNLRRFFFHEYDFWLAI